MAARIFRGDEVAATAAVLTGSSEEHARNREQAPRRFGTRAGGRRLLVCVFATKKKIGAAAEASSDATEARPAEGSALTKIAKHDEQVLAQECACVVS